MSENLHPNLVCFMQDHEESARRNGNYRSVLGQSEKLFLQNVWGPAFQFDFSGLKAEYPLRDFKGGDRFADFIYNKGGIRLIIEIDGYTTHVRDISPGDYDDHLTRQNDLILAGWTLMRFSLNQIRKRSTVCQRQVMQAIGHWWTLANNGAVSEDVNTWAGRKKSVVLLAMRRQGLVRCADLVSEYGVGVRTAYNWLQRFMVDGTFVPEQRGTRVMGYRLAGYDPE